MTFGVAWFPARAIGQATPPVAAKPAIDSARMAGMADGAMSGPMDENSMKHMEMTPTRISSHADSVRANTVAIELKQAISKYQDTAVAVADGYKMFLPSVKTQRVYHFTNSRRALLAVFHFSPGKPTSLLYKRGSNGKLYLTGAMYTMPKSASLRQLDDRLPLSIGRWHKHVNWCIPQKGDDARWAETKNGQPVFGPASPIATKAECDAVRGDFHETVFGWMLHANVYEGHDLGSIFNDDHESGHKM
ncbi:MAG: hypothetical protein ABI442_03765 [Gemmatimonadaceae bacterium]